MEFVDSHQHFQDLDSLEYPWLIDPTDTALEGNIDPIRSNYSVRDYLSDLASFNVIKSVHVENGCTQQLCIDETKWLSNLKSRTGFPTVIVAYVDLASSTAAETLDEHRAFELVRGVRQRLTWHPEQPFASAKKGLMGSRMWRAGFSQLASRGLSFDLQIIPHQFDEAFELAASYPYTPIALTHLGLPVDRTSYGISLWKSGLHKLAELENIHVKLSGFQLGAPEATYSETIELVYWVLDEFGTHRCMLGSNLPVDRLYQNGRSFLDFFNGIAKQLNEAELAQILRKTAEEFYRF